MANRVATCHIRYQANQKAILKARQINKDALPLLTQFYNEALGLEFSQRFWDIVLSPVLDDLGAIYCLPPIKDLGPQEFSKCFDLIEFHYLLSDPQYAKFRSEKNGPQIVSTGVRPSTLFSNVAAFCVSVMLSLLLKFKSYRVGVSRIYLKPINELLLCVKLGVFPVQFLRRRLKIRSISTVSITSKRLEFISSLEEGSTKAYINYLLKSLPKIYLGYLPSLISQVKKNMPVFTVKLITGNDYYYNEIFKVLAALSVERSAKYSIVQHGGFFEASYFSTAQSQIRTADEFYAWGPYISRFYIDVESFRVGLFQRQISGNSTKRTEKEKPEGDFEKIIIILNADIENYLYGQAFHYDQEYARWYKGLVINLCIALKSYFGDSVLIKPYHTSYERKTAGLVDEVISRFGERSIYNGSFSEILVGNFICVNTYLPQASFSECLANDKYVFSYGNKEMFSFLDDLSKAEREVLGDYLFLSDVSRLIDNISKIRLNDSENFSINYCWAREIYCRYFMNLASDKDELDNFLNNLVNC